jgi:hypothetical protein
MRKPVIWIKLLSSSIRSRIKSLPVKAIPSIPKLKGGINEKAPIPLSIHALGFICLRRRYKTPG